MKSIRSFIAIPLATEVHRAAGKLIRRLREPEDRIKWVPTDNLHLTLKFLGDVDNTEVPQVCGAIRGVCESYEPFELVFRGTGGFPNLQRPRVLYAGIEDSSGSLSGMVSRLERELAGLGFKPEPRDYTPHLTLGRARSGSRSASDEVVQRMLRDQETELGSMRVDTVQLMASFLDKQGPTYQIMDTIRL